MPWTGFQKEHRVSPYWRVKREGEVDGEKDRLYKIGEVSRLSGVPVKTIRHYSDEGVLSPSGYTETGYRLYSRADLARLETARTLRAAGLGLPTIRRLLAEEIGPREAVQLQLDAVDLQLKALTRQRALLESSLGTGDEETARPYPDRARALALLSAHEREAFVRRHLEGTVEGVPMDPAWKEWFWEGAVLDLPEHLTDEGLDAWVELAELVSDEGFAEAVEKQARPFWESVEGDFDFAAWNEAGGAAMREAILAVREGRSPRGEREQRVVERYLGACARAMNREGDTELAEWLLSHYEATVDPRPERYWHLIGVVKGWPEKPPHGEAYRWLMEGLRWRIGERREDPGAPAPG